MSAPARQVGAVRHGCADAGGSCGNRLAGVAGHRAATNRSNEAIEARQRALQVAAQYAASEILKEINRRFEILNQLAGDAELRKQMVQINEQPERRDPVEAARRLARRSEGGSCERRGVG